MKVYHYTKGIHLNSIFVDGFIATEQYRNLNQWAPFPTDLVWFTEKTICPKTAFPFISSIPSTDLGLLGRTPNMVIDYKEIAKHIGGFWRFGFDSTNQLLEKWHWSEARRLALESEQGRMIEKIANEVGDEPRKFWVSNNNVPLEKVTLEYLSPVTGCWELVMSVFSNDDMSLDTQERIAGLCELSKNLCGFFGYPQQSYKKAA